MKATVDGRCGGEGNCEWEMWDYIFLRSDLQKEDTSF